MPALDKTPGWVGDATGDEDIGCIGFGGGFLVGYEGGDIMKLMISVCSLVVAVLPTTVI